MRGRLARNTLIGTTWQAARVLCQAAWMVVIARALGPHGLGVLSGLLSLATTLAGLSGLGGAMLLLQRVSRQPESFSRYWRQSLVLSLSSSGLLVAAFLLLSPPQHSWILVLAIACSDVICAPFIVLCSHAFQAQEKMGWYSALPTINAFLRLVAALGFWFFVPGHDFAVYAMLHALTGLLSATIAFGVVLILLKPGPSPFVWSMEDARAGSAFSAQWFIGNAITELDKTLALRMGGGDLAGTYAAAYRFASVMAMPIIAFISAIQPRLFRDSSGQRKRLLRHSLVAILGWAFVGGIALQLTAQLIPTLLGSQFSHSAELARWLALWMPLYGLRLLATSVLTSQGRQLLRICVECAGLGFMLLLAAWLIPLWGSIGAVTMAIGTEASVCMLAWAAVACHQRR